MKVSVIIPVFNSEMFLRRCLDSVLQQTYPYLEIILINDGSTDNSLKIIDEYALQDSRILAIHKANGGIGSAYKVAIEKMSGDYVLFVDSDDTIEAECCEVLLQHSKRHNSEIVLFGCSIRTSSGDFLRNRSHGEDLRIIESKSCIEEYFINTLKHPSLSCLFKREFFTDVILFNQNVGIDEQLMPQLLQHSKKIVYTPKSLYNVTAHEDSVSRSKYTLLKLRQTIKVFDFVLDFTKNSMKMYHSYMKVKYLRALSKVISDAFAIDGNDQENEVFLSEAKKAFKVAFHKHYASIYSGEFNLRQIAQIHMLYAKTLN